MRLHAALAPATDTKGMVLLILALPQGDGGPQ